MKTPPLPSPGKGPASRQPRSPLSSRPSQRIYPTSEKQEQPQSFSRTAKQSPDVDEPWNGGDHFISSDHQHPSFSVTTHHDELESQNEERPEEDDNLQKLADLKRRMDEKLIMQQQRRGSSGLSSAGTAKAKQSHLGGSSEENATPSSRSLALGSDPTSAQTTSTESGRTIKGKPRGPAPGKGDIRTPSYPFPRMDSSLSISSQSRGHPTFHRPFTLLSPTIQHETLGERVVASSDGNISNLPSAPSSSRHDTLPPENFNRFEDPNFPAPNLYEVCLTLNSEPGLEAWWLNVVQIMQEYYAAERVTLAVPGDPTDLENVPWGQKATFNSHKVGNKANASDLPGARESALSKNVENLSLGEFTKNGVEKDSPMSKMKVSVAKEGRPALPSRHSFAGYVRKTEEALFRENNGEGLRRPKGPQRATSSASIHDGKIKPIPRQKAKEGHETKHLEVHEGEEKVGSSNVPDSLLGRPQPARVYHIPQPLEMEADPLIKRSGIVRLLSRDKVVVLTREYSSEQELVKEIAGKGKTKPSLHGPGHDEKAKEATSAHLRSSSAMNTTRSSHHGRRPPFTLTRNDGRSTTHIHTDDSLLPRMSKRSYEEYEQAPASPWSQSPAPSPAARVDPEHNPFFTQPSVDEDAFAGHTDVTEDYSQKWLLEAIGVDQSKSIVHIPLYRAPAKKVDKRFSLRLTRPSISPSDPVYSAQGDEADFEIEHETPTPLNPQKPHPIGILSILSSAIPYPSNLVVSLEDLIPFLTNSFSLAQQFSMLEKQSTVVRHLSHQDLGGTFSTTSNSQLEAVIEQRDQLYSPTADDEAPSGGSSVASPGELAALRKEGQSVSNPSTPAWDPSHVGLSSSAVTTPAHRAVMEGADSYFSARTPGVQPAGSLKISSPRRVGPKPRNPEYDHQRSISRHSRLHTLGANLGATFPTLQESPNTLPPIGRTQDTSKRITSGPVQHAGIKNPSDRLTRLVLDFLPLQIFTAEPKTGSLTWVNSKFIAYRNQDAQHIFDDPWQSIFEADKSDFLKGWSHALQHEAQYSCQLRLKRFDDTGDCRWFHFRAVAMLNSSGVAVHWLGTLTDIHKQHQAEVEAAREKETVATEAKYKALANLSPLVVFAAQEDMGVIFVNDQWEAFSGQKFEDARHFGFISHVHPDDIGKFKFPTSRGPKKAVPPSPASSSLSTHGSEESESSTDKTVQGDTQVHDLDTSDNGPDVMPALVDLANRGIVKISQDHKGKTSYSAEVRLRADNGKYRWHLVRLVQVGPGDFGHFGTAETSWYGTCTDINDQKKLEQKLHHTMESKSNFFSTMSHELRTPLNGIIGNIPFLLEGDLNQEQTSLLETMQGSAVNLLDLINNIMDLSKVEAGRMSISMHWFHVRSVIEDVNDTVAPKAIEKGLELNYLVDEDVPSMVKGDPFRIRQVLINLVSNAIKFTSEGGVFVHCGVRQDRAGCVRDNEQMLDFEVIDTGMGFTDEQAKLLFKQFSQIDGSNTQHHGGSGLGLMISRQLVELHGGKLVAKSTPNVGSTFSFFVKFNVPEGDDRPSSPPRPEALSRMSTASSVASRAPAQSPDVAKFNREFGQESPAVNSSASSDPSVRSTSNLRSERSSLSSIVSHPEGSPMKLSMPSDRRRTTTTGLAAVEESSMDALMSSISSTAKQPRKSSVDHDDLHPAMYSILVICPAVQHCVAIAQHIQHVIPSNVPHSVTDCSNLEMAKDLIAGDDSVLFTHIVLNLRDTSAVVSFLRLILQSKSQLPTRMVIVTDHVQKRKLVDLASTFDFARLELDNKVNVVYRPSKPSKFAVVFDPEQERDLSKDRNRTNAKEISDNFKVTSQLVKDTIGDRGYRFLIVEDNKTNLDVMLRYLKKIRVNVEVAEHGLECTNLVFAQDSNYYSLILCDLKMPIKDGFETVRDIRIWEASKKYSPIPIIALSANAMPEDIDRALKCGFSTYFTKPVNFPEFGRALLELLAHRIPPVPSPATGAASGGVGAAKTIATDRKAPSGGY